MVRWTVDLERDFGGRSWNTLGMKYGLPKIVELFEHFKVNATFFVSTELLAEYEEQIRSLQRSGHTLGSHGHFHVVWKDKWRAEEDRRISNVELSRITLTQKNLYRAPKFSHITDCEYSDPINHVSILKRIWYRQRIPKEPIFYIHPFDIVADHQDAPNLLCRVLYSTPREVYNELYRLLKEYN